VYTNPNGPSAHGDVADCFPVYAAEVETIVVREELGRGEELLDELHEVVLVGAGQQKRTGDARELAGCVVKAPALNLDVLGGERFLSYEP
jgi:hypothetical protein